MKPLFHFSAWALLLVTAVALSSFRPASTALSDSLTGAWQLQDAGDEHVALFMDGYFTYTHYSKNNKQFTQTMGGTYKTENNQLAVNLEFNAENKAAVGQTVSYPYTLDGDVLTVTVDGQSTTWKRLDNSTAPLAGVWRITGRMQQDKIVPVQQTGTRKTVKILTGNRFQWVAIDVGTKEFFGTGGGTYTFANGKYTENIDFFSRDNSRVGASLTFDGKLQNDGWHHSGLSSRGDKIYEIWNKVTQP